MFFHTEPGCESVETDAAGNIKPTKAGRGEAARKIDGIVAAIMAIGGWMTAEPALDIDAFLDNPVFA